MSNVIYICPKDGTQHDDTTSHYCEVCGGGLRFYCNVHSEWLIGETCPKCVGISATAPVTPAQVAAVTAVAIPASAGVVTPPAPTRMPSLVIAPVAQTLAPPRPVLPAAVPSAAPSNAPFTRLAGCGLVLLMFGLIGMFMFGSKTVIVAPPRSSVITQPQPPKPPVRNPAPVAPARISDETTPFPEYPPRETSVFRITQDLEQFRNKLIEVTGVIVPVDESSFELFENGRSIVVRSLRLPRDVQAKIREAPNSARLTVTGLLRRDDAGNDYILAREIKLRL